MEHTEHTSPKYNLSGSLLYSLHIRPGGRNVECNQFSIAIQPDYGGGITQEDAENEAARIHSILTEYDQLKVENERVKRLLHDLTPGGSEFYNNPEYCAKWIRENREESVISLMKKIKDLGKENEILKKALTI